MSTLYAAIAGDTTLVSGNGPKIIKVAKRKGMSVIRVCKEHGINSVSTEVVHPGDKFVTKATQTRIISLLDDVIREHQKLDQVPGITVLRRKGAKI